VDTTARLAVLAAWVTSRQGPELGVCYYTSSAACIFAMHRSYLAEHVADLRTENGKDNDHDDCYKYQNQRIFHKTLTMFFTLHDAIV